MRRVVHVLTVPDSLRFIDDAVRCAQRRRFAVTVVTAPGDELWRFGERLGVDVVGLEIARRIAPCEDWRALGELVLLLRAVRPHVVHAHTPKGGLLGTLAARAIGVPVRIYHMRGLPHATATGVHRTLLATTERLACAAATQVICQSHSLRATAVADAIVDARRAEVLLAGSNGVDAQGRFVPTRHSQAGRALRTTLGIGADAVVYAFVGRVVRDKGVPELLEAFERVAEGPPVALLVAGPHEERDAIAPEVRQRLESHPAVRVLGPVAEPAVVYAASDVVVLPSHREGFPNVPLEAAAMGLPVIATRVPGCVDAVVDGTTGTLVGVADVDSLASAMRAYREQAELRRTHGAAGRARVLRDFDRARIAEAIVDRYEEALTEAEAPGD